ncbi:MAG: class I SAM-dependent methyltransferase [bacterium]|nr:MAG: class I SAM-dependent methyltransferase [bacterium]
MIPVVGELLKELEIRYQGGIEVTHPNRQKFSESLFNPTFKSWLYGTSKNNMKTYYADSLSAHRLKQCYDLAPPRVRQYLNEEINFVRRRIQPGQRVLELGCGYGRVLKALSPENELLVGIDNSLSSLQFGKNEIITSERTLLLCMDAGKLGFQDHAFDVVFCIQNGISALGLEPEVLIQEALRITKPAGKIILSSYSEKFWEERLNWFRIQAEHELIGEIDDNSTGDGIIICKDGFKATTFTRNQFAKLLSRLGNDCDIYEVDESSIICEIRA